MSPTRSDGSREREELESEQFLLVIILIFPNYFMSPRKAFPNREKSHNLCYPLRHSTCHSRKHLTF